MRSGRRSRRWSTPSGVARIGDLIADGYRRIPQDDDEVAAATRAAIRSIHEEPW